MAFFVSRRFTSRIHEISDMKKARVLSLRAEYTRLRYQKKHTDPSPYLVVKYMNANHTKFRHIHLIGKIRNILYCVTSTAYFQQKVTRNIVKFIYSLIKTCELRSHYSQSYLNN